MSLIARHVEARGLPTLVLGSALDILRAGRPPRARFLDYPLGFEAGKPGDPDNQRAVLETALRAFDEMAEPGIERLPFDWPEGWAMIKSRDEETDGEDTRSPRDTTPRYQTEADRIAAEAR